MLCTKNERFKSATSFNIYIFTNQEKTVENFSKSDGAKSVRPSSMSVCRSGRPTSMLLLQIKERFWGLEFKAFLLSHFYNLLENLIFWLWVFTVQHK